MESTIAELSLQSDTTVESSLEIPHIYILSTNDERGIIRRAHLHQEIAAKLPRSTVHLIVVDRDPTIGRSANCALGHARVFKEILASNALPALVLEDDCTTYNIPADQQLRDVPVEANVLFLGASKCSHKTLREPLQASDGDWDERFADFQEINNSFWFRCWNMLSAHAIVYCDREAVAIALAHCIEAAVRGMPWDVLWSAAGQPSMKCFVAKSLWFYQDHRFGGEEEATKFTPVALDQIRVPRIASKCLLVSRLFTNHNQKRK